MTSKSSLTSRINLDSSRCQTIKTAPLSLFRLTHVCNPWSAKTKHPDNYFTTKLSFSSYLSPVLSASIVLAGLSLSSLADRHHSPLRTMVQVSDATIGKTTYPALFISLYHKYPKTSTRAVLSTDLNWIPHLKSSLLLQYFSKLSAHPALSKIFFYRPLLHSSMTCKFPLANTYYYWQEQVPWNLTFSTINMKTIPEFRSECTVQFQHGLSLSQSSPNLFFRYYFGKGLLIHIDVTTKPVETHSTSFSLFSFATVFCTS